MENTTMECEKCGGTMKKINTHKMRCDNCGAIMNIHGDKKDTSQETKK